MSGDLLLFLSLSLSFLFIFFLFCACVRVGGVLRSYQNYVPSKTNFLNA